jgi:hypothetical protein
VKIIRGPGEVVVLTGHQKMAQMPQLDHVSARAPAPRRICLP